VNARDTQAGGSHYKKLRIQPWDIYDTWPPDMQIGAYRANCLKYVMRLMDKDDPLTNAEKLLHYSQKLVEVLKSHDE